MNDQVNLSIDGHVKIWDPVSREVYVDKHNAINAETMSLVAAHMLQGNNNAYIYEMHFGNGGAIIDETGNITYKDVSLNLEAGTLAGLYNPTYFKVVDAPLDPENGANPDNEDPTKNKVEIVHTEGLKYTDLVITCTLKQDEPDANSPGNLVTPAVQRGLDDAPDFTGEFIFNELGLRSKGTGSLPSYLLSQIVFHPVQKSANRVIQVVYTLRLRVT